MKKLAEITGKSWLRYLCALFLGVLTTLAFAPFNAVWLLILTLSGLVALWSSSAPRQAFFLGWWFGVGHFATGLYWVVISTYVYGGAPLWISAIMVSLLVSYCALYPALVGYAGRRWAWSPLPWASLQLPLLWGLAELLRGWIGTGFPWLSLGYAGLETPLLRLAPIAGVFGISAAFIFLAASLWLLLAGQGRTRLAALGGLFLLPATLYLLPAPGHWTVPVGEPLSVGLVQGNIAQEDRWRPAMLKPTLERYMQLSGELPDDTRLIIWPEAAVPALYQHVEEHFFKPLHSWAEGRQATVLGGALRLREDDRIINTQFPVGLDSGSMYIKRHLVPFGEFFPVPDFIRVFMEGINVGYEDIAAGPREQALVEVAGYKLGISICFEDVFGRDIRRDLPEADILVNVTNDGWFADSSAPHQHLQIARMRAVETGRPLLRVSNRGVSAHIRTDGQLQAATGFLATEWVFTTVSAHQGVTPYVRRGDWPLWLAGMLVLLGSMSIRRHSGKGA